MKKQREKKQRSPKAIPKGRGWDAYMGSVMDHPHGALVLEYRHWQLAKEQAESPSTPQNMRETFARCLPDQEKELGQKLLRAGPKVHASVAKRAAEQGAEQSFRAKVREVVIMARERSGLVPKKSLEETAWKMFTAQNKAKVGREAFRQEFSKALKATGLQNLPRKRKS